jgi:uncharacterized protein (TIGR02452 family)
MSLVEVAKETRRVVAEGRYRAPSGAVVEIGERVRRSIAGTVLYDPAGVAALGGPGGGGAAPEIVVTDETTGAAARRLAGRDVLLLNFASARNPGGGFLGGARAQEEDLCRCSSLYDAIEPQQRYYEANRRASALLYTDHLHLLPPLLLPQRGLLS